MRTTILSIILLTCTPLAFGSEIKVEFSPEFTKTLTKDYGLREGEVLTKEITEDLQRALTKNGLNPARIDVTILDAKPNHPTFEQLRERPGLDAFRSRSIGGLSVQGVAYDAAGKQIAETDYAWFESDIRHVFPSDTWADARRASDRFASRMTKALKQ